MLGLLLIYFIGKKFHTLAGQYHKNQWGFAIAGIASYYVGTIVGGIVLVILFELWGSTSVDEMDNLGLNLIAIPFGILACVGFYMLLEKNWKRKPVQTSSDLLDDEML